MRWPVSRSTRLALAVALLVACKPHVQHPVSNAGGDEVTLYRDFALVRQRIAVDVTAATTTTVKIEAAAGLTGEQIIVMDHGGLAITGVHVAGDIEALAPLATTEADPPTSPEPESTAGCHGEGCLVHDPDDVPEDTTPPPAPIAKVPTEIRFDLTAPHPGHYTIAIAYVTDRLQWNAAYTMTTTPARERAVLHGAIAIRNTSGIVLRDVALQVVDSEIGAWRGRTAEHLATSLVGATPSTTPAAIPRDLGMATLGDGETRVTLSRLDSARSMRSVLVYDPFGTKLDNASPSPIRDPVLGVSPIAATHITESFEVARDEAATRGLPAGPVRLLERRRDGVLAVLGESRLFDAATRVSDVDTIAVGTAEGVVAHRERREITIDDERRRITEEFVITIDNTRDHAVGVLVREHLYRGLNWALSWESTKRATKEGAQQIALRSDVPAKTSEKIMYVVVYTWSP